MRILLVDDNADISLLFSMAFQIEGHTTRVANNGVEAVAAVEQEPFDAIVMDLEMPIMGGLEATQRIRSLPNGHRVPIVVFTGYQYKRSDALQVGANDLVYKPIDPMKLMACIRENCCPH